ncbi:MULTISPECIES: ATP-binding protein [unclassified Tenacibaculum]|uniref:sensor histidine kinase n=1 Tax=unclassified Tenacibaculum TaxID=2635139 RepID=UPI001F35A537|nr:HAMP domain-containing sensor histidine kinase [Tenacibaculum sp. Cn5-34]MCF2875671.1 HAMP domain-containing histidine kinase [Tenacibaculum sp. Cn5-1]MCF2935747.1 HAMP domain-containing histidine kinase [Tenacibaculum sp. Cn5-34]MCG7512307.1 HAMP domain-containing histidine kinase [Tenacibaculum sp. Cn5-46]
MNLYRTVSNKLIKKIKCAFFVIILIIGGVYIYTTFFLLKQFYSQTTQQLNANVATHLVEEKFKNDSPFLENGAVNKSLFNDLMHDMMAVNRAIEVYLLNEEGGILYSVVLEHNENDKNIKSVDLKPIKEFIKNNQSYVLGDDPRDETNKKIFSAAYFEKDGQAGYIYIILASQKYQQICEQLLTKFFFDLSIGSTLITMLFAIVVGWISIWFLTGNLRTIIYYVNKFKEGDLSSRIPNAASSDLSTLALTYNSMAETIANNIQHITEVNQFRKEFIADVAHDLRTPLTAIKGYIETLKIKENITIKDRFLFMSIIENSASHLGNMINELFEYTKFEAKKVTAKKSFFSVIDLVFELQKRYELISTTKKITLSVVIKNNIVDVYADKLLIERAIQNIIENAIKFTPNHGEISIELLDKNEEFVILKIIDTGEGICKIEQEYILKSYTQLNTNDKNKGIGLGLSIVKKILELHQTELRITNNKNKGTCFEFTLPYKCTNNKLL